MDVITLDAVTKRYGKVAALDSLTLSVRAGTITALLGPNGAGKSTMLEIITGLRDRDSGAVDVLGADPGREQRRLAERIGVQVQEFNLQATVKVRESLAFFASLYRHPMDVDQLLAQFGLAEKENALFPSLSGGQKRRLAIAKALVGDPELVILDEPTSGLDPQGQEFLRKETQRLRRDGRTVLLSTHDVLDAETLADRVIIIDGGRVVAAGTPAEIVAERCGAWRAQVHGTVSSDVLVDPTLTVVEDDETTVVYGPDRDQVEASIDPAAVVSLRAPSLHDAYFMITGSALRS